MRNMFILGLVSMSYLVGCGQPMYPYKEPQVTAEKTMWGARLTISSDASGRIRKMTFDPKTGQVAIDDAELSTQASPVLREYGPLMAQYAAQQQAYATIRQTEWQGLNQLASTIAPVVGQAIAGHEALAGLKVVRPRLVEEAAMLIASGKVDANELLRRLPPEVVADVRERLTLPTLTPLAKADKR